MAPRKKKDIECSRDELITRYYGYVEVVVGTVMKRRALPREIYDELISAGYLGLVEAAERYNPKANDNFKAYAFNRIRGAVIDFVRKASGTSRANYRHAKAVEVINELGAEAFIHNEIQSGRSNVEATLAAVLDYAAQGALVYRMTIGEQEEELGEEEQLNPEEQLEQKQIMQKIYNLMETLTDKERLVIEELYFRDKTITEITHDHAELSKSWICRLHSRGIARLQKALSAQDDSDADSD